MKRNYMKPTAEAISLQSEGLIAASYNDKKGNGRWHAPSRGWNSEDWSQPADAPEDGEE